MLLLLLSALTTSLDDGSGDFQACALELPRVVMSVWFFLPHIYTGLRRCFIALQPEFSLCSCLYKEEKIFEVDLSGNTLKYLSP